MTKIWNIVDSGLSIDSSGHHYSETKAVAEELLRRHARVRIFGHRNAPTPLFPGAEVIPAFSLYRYLSVSNDPVWSALENFVVHNRTDLRDLAEQDQSLFAGSVVFFPTVDDLNMLGTLRWLARFDGAARPKTVMLLHALRAWSPDHAQAHLLRRTWTNAPAQLRDAVLLCVREEEAAERFESLLGTRPHVVPCPLGPLHLRHAARPANDSGRMTVAFVGGARRDRGAPLLPEIVRSCAGRGVDFVIQAKAEDRDVDMEPFKPLDRMPGVRLHKGAMQDELYYDTIANSVVLLPYPPHEYDVKSSGVHIEAKFLGAPVIAPEYAPLGAEVKRYGNGVTFAEYSVESIADAIMRAGENIVALRKAAAALAKEFRERHGADRFVDAVEGLLDTVRPSR